MPYEQLATLAAVLLALTGAVLDARSRTLPNWLSLALALAAASQLAVSEGWEVLASGGLHAGVVLIIGLPLFAKGWLGGGDVKFYAAAALGVPLAQGAELLLRVSTFGLLLTVAMALFAKLRDPQKKWADLRGIPVPFGVAIAAGFILTILG